MSRSVPAEVTPPSRFGDAWRRRLSGTDGIAVEHLGPGGGDRVLVVTAHPDDETLAMGATIAALVGLGATVDVVSLSRGEHALLPVGREVPDLANRRVSEMRGAVDVLGVRSAVALGFPDGDVGSFVEEATDAVRVLVEDRSPQHVLTLWRDDPHPDHRAAHAVARNVGGPSTGIPLLEFPLWAFHWTDPDELRVPVRPVVTSDEAMRSRGAALACYVSQTRPLLDDVRAVLPDEVVGWDLEGVVVQP